MEIDRASRHRFGSRGRRTASGAGRRAVRARGRGRDRLHVRHQRRAEGGRAVVSQPAGERRRRGVPPRRAADRPLARLPAVGSHRRTGDPRAQRAGRQRRRPARALRSNAVSRAIDRDGITIASFVPAMLAQVLEVRGTTQPPATLRAVLLGGAPAPAPLLERAAKARWPLLPTYGLTEACSQVATLPVGAPLRTDGGGLRPLPGVELRIADDDERVRQPGTTGEIHVRGATVTPGYWQRPEASRQRLAGGWLRTGDLGVLDADGALRVVGRADDCIITGGENVHPAEVETVLLAHPDVADVGVAGLADPVYGERVAAWVVRHPGSPVDAATLERFARTQLTHYKVPRSWQFVPALPRNAGGKLQRRKLGDETPAT
ncbi:MAG: AMP-binding protein [Myxococcota bacterium]|nr:AMP-binding protein [Myxococcota bacterium]